MTKEVSLKKAFKIGFDWLKKAIETDYFIYFIGFITLLAGIFGLDMLGFTVTILIFALIQFTKINIRSTVPIIIMFIYVVSMKNSPIKDAAYYINIGHIILFGILGAILVGSAIYGCIKRKLKLITRINFWALVLVSFAFIFGGVLYKDYKITSMLIGTVMAFYFLGSFCYFSLFIKKADFDYIAKTLITASLVVVGELAFYYLTLPDPSHFGNKELIVFGWGISNAIAVMILTGMPCVIYYMSKSKRPVVQLLLLIFLLVGILFTYSRAALVIAIPLFVAGCVYAPFVTKGRERKLLIIFEAVFALAAVIFVIIKWDTFVKAMQFYIDTGFSDRGRFDLIKEAFSKFLKAPIFGVGIADSTFESDFIFMYFYHNTFMQFLAWSGAIGLLIYIFHLFAIGYCYKKNNNAKRFFIGLTLFMAFAHSMLDCVIYYPYLTFIYMLCLAYIENDYHENPELIQPEKLIQYNKLEHPIKYAPPAD